MKILWSLLPILLGIFALLVLCTTTTIRTRHSFPTPIHQLLILRRQLEENTPNKTTLQKMDEQLEMLQDEMEDLLEQKQDNPSSPDVDHLIGAVQGQIDQVQAEKEAELAKQQQQSNATGEEAAVLKQEAYEETEEEEEALEEEIEELESEEHWTRYVYIGLFLLLGLWYLWFRHVVVGKNNRASSSSRISYRTIPTADTNSDAAVGEIELERQ